MSTITVIRKPTDAGLSEDIKHEADKGAVVTPGYIVLRRDAYQRLSDEFDDQLAAEAMGRDKDFQEGPSLEDVRKEYGL